MTALLEITQLEVVYNQSILAVKQVDLVVPQHHVVALLGANGAGKSSTLKAISQLISVENGLVSKGDIHFNGESILNINPSDLVKKGLVQVLEGRHCFSHLTIDENLRTGAFLNNPSKKQMNTQLERIYDLFPRLADKKSTQAGYTSGGEQQMLAIGRALMTQPKLILLDEPSMGLAPKITDEIFQLIQQLQKSEGLSFLIAEQNIQLALQYANTAYLIENGEVRISGDPRELYQTGEIQRAYLGEIAC
jgi:branched-chain amino acid transport system ATP-binding protein